MATAKIFNNTKDCIVVLAETGWKYYVLMHGDTSETISVDDPDNFCVYDASGNLVVNVQYNGGLSDIWRIHDGTYVSVDQDDNGSVTLKKVKVGMGSDPHRCTGRWPLCSDGKLKRDAVGLNYPAQIPISKGGMSSGPITL
jgi:hypothetical protein